MLLPKNPAMAPSTDVLPSTWISPTINGKGIGTGLDDNLIESSSGRSLYDTEEYSNNESLEQQRFLQTPMRLVMRCLVGLMLLSCIIYVIIDFTGDRKIESILLNFLEWTHTHIYEGIIAVILCYIIATICFIPGSLLSFGTGFAIGSSVDNTFMGIVLSSTCVFIGAFIGSICSFILGRYLFRDFVLQLAFSYPIFQAIERALENNGLKIMVLLRLSPLIPYNALDYISGVTSISLRDYTIALLGMLPGIIMLCSIGATASGLSDRTFSTSNTTIKIMTIVSGLLFGGCGVFMASYYSKLELDRVSIAP